jgi:hypothetical protein
VQIDIDASFWWCVRSVRELSAYLTPRDWYFNGLDFSAGCAIEDEFWGAIQEAQERDRLGI